MKNKECFVIANGLADIRQVPYSELTNLGEEKLKYLHHTDFIIICAKNKKLVETHIEILNEIKKPSKEYETYQEARRDLAKKYAKKDDNGNPIVNRQQMGNGQVFESYTIENITDQNSDYNKAVRALDKKHDKEITEQKGKDEQFELAMEQEADIQLKSLKYNLLPKGLSIVAAEAILYFLEDPEGENENTPASEKKKK